MMTIRPLLLALALTTALAGHAAPTAAGPQAGSQQVASSKADQLDQLYAQYWEENLKLNPLAATSQGDPRYNDQLPNFFSADYRQRTHDFNQRWLDKVETVGSEGLESQDLLSYEIFVRKVRSALEGEQFPDWMQPVDQFGGIITAAAQLGSGTGAQPFRSVKDYDNWLARGARFPVLVDQAIANMKQGVEAGVVQPKVLMVKVLPQLDALIKPEPAETVFWGPIERMPAGFSDADKQRLTTAYATMVDDQVMPSLQRLRDYIADDYLPATRDTFGLDKLPNGEAWYAYRVRQSTTTNRTPAQIHQIGLDEVARIQGEMRKVMQQVGFKGDLQDFFAFLRSDPRFTFKTEQALLDHYKGIEKTVDANVSKLFSLTPKAGFEIRPIEAFRAKSAAGGQYNRPSEDGSRPGIFYANTYDLPSRKSWEMPDLYLHEAIPGHHFQLALQQELTDLPTFRRFGGETAFSEGWGLYAESLGKPLGVYDDPYDYFGSLQGELWRAIRLVVDTGLHSKSWRRDQTIQYMMDNSAISETNAIAETERYMAIPGQALAYKSGELKIKELRARAEKALGDDFDIREFHAEVLKDGSVPLDVLEGKIDRWIARKRA